jgi:hypothetical protein
MKRGLRTVTILLGILTALAIVSQLALAIMILAGGSTKIRAAHIHTGFLTVTLTRSYLALSLSYLLRPSERSGR